MEIRINLLPQVNSRKERRSAYLLPFLAVTAIIFFAAFLVYTYFDAKESLRTLTEKVTAQTSERDQKREELTKRTNGINEYNFKDKHKLLNNALNGIYKNTIELQKSIYMLLPENAKVASFSYLNTGEASLTIKFYSKGDSAIFLHDLLNAEFIEDAKLISISANDKELIYESDFELKLKILKGDGL
ncbi:PilN domain-containing protein [Cytobacillus sp. NCCP-133]|uniref:PilN domain-containing protein n=1 Tax=Cytobacillus sp. NCCP-133 TaxID=766848 RepID=UPI0022305CEF|nr:hypothetical protein [Cytobacillus sp. NCCP-133]GLB58377.1 hypothetical protein NCCP133_05100 [Cytobacillus sp. NCCP-133]